MLYSGVNFGCFEYVVGGSSYDICGSVFVCMLVFSCVIGCVFILCVCSDELVGVFMKLLKYVSMFVL